MKIRRNLTNFSATHILLKKEKNFKFVLKDLNTSLWINFASNSFLQDTFHWFDLEMPPKNIKHAFCGSLNS